MISKIFSDVRGQAFSTFKLLIAAIVAIIILTFLLGVLNIIPFFGFQGDPLEQSVNLIKDLKNNPGVYKETRAVTFAAGGVVTKRQIVSKAEVGLAPEQLCFSLGEFEDSGGDPPFDLDQSTDAGSLRNSTDFTVDAKIGAICDKGTVLDESARVYDDEPGTGFKAEWVDRCECIGSSRTCCALILRSN